MSNEGSGPTGHELTPSGSGLDSGLTGRLVKTHDFSPYEFDLSTGKARPLHREHDLHYVLPVDCGQFPADDAGEQRIHMEAGGVLQQPGEDVAGFLHAIGNEVAERQHRFDVYPAVWNQGVRSMRRVW